MKWAVLGHAGMLGQDLMSALSSREVTGFDRAEFDITEIDSVKSILSGFDVVVNCAAWTAVDDAEVNEAAALAINGEGPRNVVKVCNEIGAKLVQISTDYVFSGDATTPYAENSEVGPKSAYGRTKLAGEVAVRNHLPIDHYIVRTAWLYGEHGPNFIKTMINLPSCHAIIPKSSVPLDSIDNALTPGPISAGFNTDTKAGMRQAPLARVRYES